MYDNYRDESYSVYRNGIWMKFRDKNDYENYLQMLEDTHYRCSHNIPLYRPERKTMREIVSIYIGIYLISFVLITLFFYFISPEDVWSFFFNPEKLGFTGLISAVISMLYATDYYCGCFSDAVLRTAIIMFLVVTVYAAITLLLNPAEWVAVILVNIGYPALFPVYAFWFIREGWCPDDLCG